MKFELEVDVDDVLKALATVGDAADPLIDRASDVTAKRIAIEARSRVARRTGKTQSGIVVEDSYFGGRVVIARRSQMPKLPRWLEGGTQFMEARPFLGPAVDLERVAHWNRISDAIQQAIDEKGLGE